MAEETITAQTPEIDPGMSVMPEEPGLMDVPTVIPELGLAAQALASQVSFAKKTWKDGSGGGTPVTAVELNRLEQGVADLTAAVNALRDSVGQTVNVNLGNVRIGERGYYSLQQNAEYLKAVNGKTKKMICIKYYDNMNPYGAFSAAGDYIIGAPNMTINNLIIVVWVAG